ncbi:hypothetical protein SODG_003116 [Sodalis praecaptivus]
MNFELFNSLKGAPDPARTLSLFPTLIPFYQALGNTPLHPVPSPREALKFWRNMNSSIRSVR